MYSIKVSSSNYTAYSTFKSINDRRNTDRPTLVVTQLVLLIFISNKVEFIHTFSKKGQNNVLVFLSKSNTTHF